MLAQHWADYDFFFVHFKYTDSTGEDGNFEAKVKRTEEFDAIIPRVTALNPDVLIVTGDHSTPAFLKSHSWHAVPTLLVSNCCRPDGCQRFGESECIRGGLGTVRSQVPDVPGPGQCRPAGQVRCVTARGGRAASSMTPALRASRAAGLAAAAGTRSASVGTHFRSVQGPHRITGGHLGQ